MAAGSKHQAWREMKRAGQIDRTGLVRVVSEEVAVNEADWIAADLLRDTGKGAKLAARNDARAFDLQMVDLDAVRRAGL
jgi:hypothetical protein